MSSDRASPAQAVGAGEADIRRIKRTRVGRAVSTLDPKELRCRSIVILISDMCSVILVGINEFVRPLHVQQLHLGWMLTLVNALFRSDVTDVNLHVSLALTMEYVVLILRDQSINRKLRNQGRSIIHSGYCPLVSLTPICRADTSVGGRLARVEKLLNVGVTSTLDTSHSAHIGKRDSTDRTSELSENWPARTVKSPGRRSDVDSPDLDDDQLHFERDLSDDVDCTASNGTKGVGSLVVNERGDLQYLGKPEKSLDIISY